MMDRAQMMMEPLLIPAAALRAEESAEVLRQLALARERLLSVEVQAAALRLARLFHESPEIGWFRFCKNEQAPLAQDREASARLLCDLWDAEAALFPESLLYPEPDLELEEDGEAEQERLMLASRYRDLEAWCESLGPEAFARLASTRFERPAPDCSEEALAELFLRQCLSPEEYARWERARLQSCAGHRPNEPEPWPAKAQSL